MCTADKKRLWLEALSNPGVWKRVCQLGLSVSLLQAVINQGDIWLGHAVSRLVVVKTVLTPLVTLAVALISARNLRGDTKASR